MAIQLSKFILQSTVGFLYLPGNIFQSMGKGDKKSKKGKRWKGSFGVSRNKKSIKARIKRASSVKKAATTGAAPKTKRAPRKKAEA